MEALMRSMPVSVVLAVCADSEAKRI